MIKGVRIQRRQRKFVERVKEGRKMRRTVT